MQAIKYSMAVGYRDFTNNCNYGALLGEEVAVPIGVAWQKGIVPINDNSIFTLFYDINGKSKGQAVTVAVEELFRIHKCSNRDTKSICRSVNAAVYEYYHQNNINGSLTAGGIRFRPNNAAVANLGTVGVYLFRKGRLDCLSVDHTVKVGRIGVNKIVTQFLGRAEQEAVVPAFSTVNMQQGDIFLLCSATVTETVERKRIVTIIEENGIDDIGICLVNEAIRKGQAASAAVVVCRAQ